MLPNRMPYRHACVDLSWDVPNEVEALIEFKQNARDVSRETFCRFVDKAQRESLERNLGYAIGSQKGLHCKDDYHVSYISGIYHGKAAFAMIHSAIEYVFGGGDPVHC